MNGFVRAGLIVLLAMVVAGCASRVPVRVETDAKVHHIGEREIFGDYIDQFSVTYHTGWFKSVTVKCWLFELDRDGPQDSYTLYCKDHRLYDVLNSAGSLESIYNNVKKQKPEGLFEEFLKMCNRNQLAVFSTD